MAFGFLKKLAKVALPIAGTALLGPLGGAAGGALGGLVSGGGVGGALGGAAAGGLGGMALGKLGGVKGLGSLFGKMSAGDLAKLGISGLGVLNASQQQGKGNAIANQLAQQQAAQAADQAKLRQQFMGKIGNLPSQAPDLGSLFQSSNPFARQPLAAIQGPAPSSTPLAMQGQPLAMPQLSPIEAQLQRLRAGTGMPTQRMQRT